AVRPFADLGAAGVSEMSGGRLKFWGWGYESERLTAAEVGRLEAAYAAYFRTGGFDAVPEPRAEDVSLRKARAHAPASLSEACTSDHDERLLHSYGKSFFDSVRVFARDFPNPPDVIAFPRSEAELIAVLDWCGSIDAVVIPWGGGSSVVAGVEPPRTDR